MFKYKLTTAYDGKKFCGWQIQPHGISIQGLIQDALSIALREKINLIGGSRTDRGVHAIGQVAHFTTTQPFEKSQLLYSLNGLLPQEIRIIDIEKVQSHFHARYSATSKIYRYRLCLSKIKSPFDRLYYYYPHKKIDLKLLKKGAHSFIGTHNFSSFTNNPNKGASGNCPIRTITRLDVAIKGEKIYLEFEADGFLYKMVRNIIGTLIEVSCGKITLERLEEIFKAKDRKQGGPAAPAHALFLIKINYNKNSSLISSKEEK